MDGSVYYGAYHILLLYGLVWLRLPNYQYQSISQKMFSAYRLHLKHKIVCDIRNFSDQLCIGEVEFPEKHEKNGITVIIGYAVFFKEVNPLVKPPFRAVFIVQQGPPLSLI